MPVEFQKDGETRGDRACLLAFDEDGEIEKLDTEIDELTEDQEGDAGRVARLCRWAALEQLVAPRRESGSWPPTSSALLRRASTPRSASGTQRRKQ